LTPSSLPSDAPSSSPSVSPSSSPSYSPSYAPSSSPSTFPSSAPSITPFTGPFRIVSDLSAGNEMWCVYPKNNVFEDLSPIAIDNCSSRDSYYWTLDEFGRIVNFERPEFCIRHLFGDMILSECANVAHSSERWLYSFNDRRILKLQNGEVGIEVSNGVAAKNMSLKLFSYGNISAGLHQSWNIEYRTGGIKQVASNNLFSIKSDLSTSGSEWCIFPQYNNVEVGSLISIGECKNWNSFKWTIDPDGKIRNVKDNSLCIEYVFKQMRLALCDNTKTNQFWTYNVLDGKILALKNGLKPVTVNNVSPSQNEVVKTLLPSEIGEPLSQTWTIVPY